MFGIESDTIRQVEGGDVLTLRPLEEDALRHQREEANAFHFNSVRPWTGNMMPPQGFNPASCDHTAPPFELCIDHVYGFRSRGARDNAHWIDAPNTILYFAAAVAAVYNWVDRSHRFFTEHEHEISCADYCPATRLAATGGIGKRSTAPIKIWNVDTMKQVQHISGFFEFNVTSVAFSVDGSRIFGIGSDTVHSVALYDVSSGVLLSKSTGDSNRILHGIAITCDGADSRKQFVTIGVSHVKFWSKTKELFVGKKAIGGNIAKQTCVSVACTTRFVLVGNVSGEMYIFSQGSLVKTCKVHTTFCGAIGVEADVIYTGGRDGNLKKWSLEPEKLSIVEILCIDMNAHSVLTGKSATRKMGNGARTISISDGHLAIGTNMGCMHVIKADSIDVNTVLDTHFEDLPGSCPELWGLCVHPTDPLFATVSEDASLRLWSAELGSLVLLADVIYPGKSCCFAPDGEALCVGHENGAFSVWDAMTLTPVHPFTRKRESEARCCAYSPDGRCLAIGMGLAHVIDLYDAKRDYTHLACCDAVSGNIRQLDWSSRSRMIRCSTTSYEIIHFNVPEYSMNQSVDVANEAWASQTCVIGWGVQGIWEGCGEGSDVNCVALSKCGTLLAVGYDDNCVRLYKYPCLPRQSDRSSKLKYPDYREYRGHGHHVTNAWFTADNRFLLTTGGMDQTIIRWRIVPLTKAAESATAAEASLPKPPSATTGPQSKGRIVELPRDTVHSTSFHRTDSTANRPNTTMRRPGSGNTSVKSRLLDSTASMVEKARHGVAQRAHLDRQGQARKRFTSVV